MDVSMLPSFENAEGFKAPSSKPHPLNYNIFYPCPI